MDYKQEFEQLVQEKRYEDARILLEQNHIHALEDPFYYANMGWILNQLERFEEAIICLKKGLQLFPEDGWMYSQIAYADDRLGKLDDALDAIDQALKLGFDEPWLHGEKGWCYKEMQKYDEAIQCFEDALMDDENNVWLLAQAAYSYLSKEDYQSAEEYFLKCYRLKPNDDSIFDLVNFYKHVNDFEKAITYLEKTSSQYEGWKQFELGNAYHELGNDGEAVDHLEQSLASGRDDTGVRTLLGDVYDALNQKEESCLHYDQALGYYEKALQRDEENDREWIWQEMIWIAHKEKNYEKKLSYLDRASAEFPNNIWMQYHYARCYSDMNDYANAVKACEKCFDLGEKSKEMLDLYAWNLGRCDKEEKAIETLLKRIDMYGGEEWNYGELGWDYAQLKDYDQALAYFEKALAVNPDSEMHISMIGWCYLRLEQYDQALSYLKHAQDAGRQDGWIFSVMGETYAAIHEYGQAINCFTEALERDYDEPWIHEEIETLREKMNKQKQPG
ncbi:MULTISPECIES: tetratricopeptide repeat protein [Bacillota]|uniref:Tetratricopeptide repeat protein n=1 Tax=Amedibacillus hominis TaxID=2897776 RepID=A0ABS9RD85_9FIRM|nr:MULTISPECIES: tetratricopeptide repeat protein [Bacillota]MCH4287605.1 tetratricopeptide repeat protein [Amedibacillus hominis]RGB48626.1 tetratricopeptide repeat protein [Absiella sp. AM22-9]RGB52689.1 tetratricopeptide repeat protein [Absiella sp. AM10-20]RGB67492.1 tetratricopeptide repeat protein [Absiella sp. AM09-45]RGB76823.1 tetratricopeptide repeat protein [Absiella sp. AM09-50]